MAAAVATADAIIAATAAADAIIAIVATAVATAVAMAVAMAATADAAVAAAAAVVVADMSRPLRSRLPCRLRLLRSNMNGALWGASIERAGLLPC